MVGLMNHSTRVSDSCLLSGASQLNLIPEPDNICNLKKKGKLEQMRNESKCNVPRDVAEISKSIETRH